jgi:hypothetical protein
VSEIARSTGLDRKTVRAALAREAWAPYRRAPMEALFDFTGAVGQLYDNVEMQAVDENEQPLPAGTEVILRIRSELCVDRYFDDPASTAEASGARPGSAIHDRRGKTTTYLAQRHNEAY